MIRLFKDSADSFLEDYLYHQNRPIHLAEVDVSSETFEQLKNHFKLTFFSQKQQLKQIQGLQQDQLLLQALLDQQSGNHTDTSSTEGRILQLAGAGLFFDDSGPETLKTIATCDTGASGSLVLAELKLRLAKHYGENFLATKIIALRNEISHLLPPAINLDRSSYNYSFSEHYADLLTGFVALNVLDEGHPLSAHACFRIDDPKLQLSEKAIEEATLFKNQLFQSARNLLDSTRPDWGYALFIILARLTVLEHSLQTRHWTFLEDDDSSAKEIPEQQLALYANKLATQRRSDLGDLYESTKQMETNSSAYEQNYVKLELAANRYHHWLESDKAGWLKYRGEHLLPQHYFPSTRFLMTDLSVAQLKLALEIRKSAEKHLLTQDLRRNTYNLLTKNCVSTLFKHIDVAVNGLSKKALGGYIDPEINVVPFQAFDAVKNTYRVKQVFEKPAYRQEQLSGMYGHEDANLVFLRESNIFSSSLYRYNPDDAWFVFFTDDNILSRPIFGAFNVVAAASQSLFGLVSWPFDEGNNIKVGLRGVLASLPELAFFNIRKGTYPYSLAKID